jgi:calcineurin-like phosphoesterase
MRIKTGATVLRNNGKATVVGRADDGRLVVQFEADKKKQINRCYMYWDDEVKEVVTNMHINNGDKFIFPCETFIVTDYYAGVCGAMNKEYFTLVSLITGNRLFEERASRSTTEERIDSHFKGKQWTYVPKGECI